jgi:hypothetical protein
MTVGWSIEVVAVIDALASMEVSSICCSAAMDSEAYKGAKEMK